LASELNLRSLKNRDATGRGCGKSPEMVRKEMWAHFLAYNLIRESHWSGREAIALKPWRISFKGALQTLNAFRVPLLTCAKSRLPDLIEEMLLAIASP